MLHLIIMKINKSLFLGILFLFVTLTMFAQVDTPVLIKKKLVLPPSEKTRTKSNINLYESKKVNTSAIAKEIKKKPQNKQNILLETLPEDKDIVGKRFWKNKDITHQKLKTTVTLGTVYSKSKTVVVECRDHSYVDGDRIEILLNGNVISENIGLKQNHYSLLITLEKGYNRIDFRALNQGLSGPNTAELKVYDEEGNLLSAREWNMLTGEAATIGIIKKE